MNSKRSILADPCFWTGFSASGLVLSLTLWYGIGVDASAYSYCAWAWANHSLPPYVGCIMGDYPGIFALHRVALWFGENALGFRIMDLILQLGAVAMIFYLARRVSGSGLAGIFASLFYATYYYRLEFMMTGERETFILCFMLLAVTISLHWQERIYPRAAAVGLLCGFIFLVKPTFGLCWPVFGAWFLAEGLGRKPNKLWLELSLFFATCLLPSILALLYYWKLGHLRDLFEVTYEFSFKVYRHFPLNVGTIGDIREVSAPGFFGYLLKEILRDYLIALAGMAIFMARPASYGKGPERRAFLAVGAMILVGFASAYLQRGAWEYQRAPFWGFALILAGCGWAWPLLKLGGGKSSGWRVLAVGAASLCLLGLMVIRVPGYLRSFALQYSFRSLDRAYAAQYPLPKDAAEYVRSLTSAEDEVGFFGNITMLPFLAQRKLTAPFPFTVYLYQRLDDGSISQLQLRWKQEYIDALLAKPPRIFMFDTACFYCPEQSLKAILRREFPEIQALLDSEYTLVRAFDGIEIYLRD